MAKKEERLVLDFIEVQPRRIAFSIELDKIEKALAWLKEAKEIERPELITEAKETKEE